MKTHFCLDHYKDIFLFVLKLSVVVFFFSNVLSCSGKKESEKSKESVSTHVYKADWKDLDTYPHAKWVDDLKLGMYWHWNMNSIPAQCGWYGRWMYKGTGSVSEYHKKHYGDLSEFGYKDFNKLFTAPKFDAKQWVDDAKYIGARFVLGLAYHHDGFSMYDDSYTPWNSVNKNPHIDVIGELKKEADKQGLKFGATSHLAYNWYYFSSMMYPHKFDADSAPKLYNVKDPSKGPSKEFVELWYKRTKELIDKYDLDMLWFDFGTIEKAFNEEYTAKVAAYFYNHGVKKNKEVALDTKFGFFNNKSRIHDVENGKFAYIRTPGWMSDCTFNDGWFYQEKESDPHINTGKYWLYQFIDIVSKNGTLLLNVGPLADGSWKPEWKKELFKLGDWMKVNSDAIYYTRPWHRFGEGPTNDGDGQGHLLGDDLKHNDVRFTTKGDTLFAIVCGWHDKPFTIKALSGKDINGLKIKHVSLLGSNEDIKWNQSDNGLTLTFPKNKPCDLAYVFAINGDNLFPQRDEYLPVRLNFDAAQVSDSLSIVLAGSDKQLAISDVEILAQVRYPKISVRNISALSKVKVSSKKYQNQDVSMLTDNFTNGNKITGQVFYTKVSKNPYISMKFDKSYHVQYMEILAGMDGCHDLLEKGIVRLYKDGKLIIESKIKKVGFLEE